MNSNESMQDKRGECTARADSMELVLAGAHREIYISELKTLWHVMCSTKILSPHP